MLTATLTLERLDKNHRLLEKIEKPSRSFCLQFIELLYMAHAQISDAAPYSMTDITGAAVDVDSRANNSYGKHAKGNLKWGSAPGGEGMLLLCGKEGNSAPYLLNERLTLLGEKLGIVVGTDNTAVAPDDYALGTQIAHGRGAGELEYGGCEMVNIAFADPNGSFDIRRYFTNLSGGPITVEEVGIYAAGTQYTGNYVYSFCAARDLTGGVAVADTELLRVTYTPQITV